MKIIDRFSVANSILKGDNLILPSFDKLTIDYEKGVYNFNLRFYDYIGLSSEFDIYDYIKEAFKLMDIVIDEKHSEVKGENFKERCKHLKKDTDDEIIFSQIYRLLIVFRNAEEHDRDSISIDNDNIVINRKDKNLKLVVKNYIIKYLLSYAFYYNKVRTIKINDSYKENIALWYYEKIISSILDYKENNNDIKLIQPKKSSILSAIRDRHICENIRYEKQGDIITFIIKQKFLYSVESNCLDFVFTIDNKSYMIPYEIVQNGTISISDLKDFEIIGDIPEYVNKLYNGLLTNIN